ncbi:PAS domain-containing sensor histidine kinase [Pontibacillus sp. HMF3514]|uniref:PAS domain-containing sensor histidine kinase n=1 Tax=Pontibacillus sp. HMF3514 TaxID=2692425 RepID=UPI00131FED86|nr:PAS domain-containing sensor histidine kinase [Pontibacillus sp. HMF3514]QHE51112.1 PAS domain S-box protein [Pontibacillus sp. HMF3514]
MRDLIHSKLTKRYLIVAIIVAIVSLTAIYYFTTQLLFHSMREEIEYRNDLMAKSISKKTSFMFEKMVNDARVISEFYRINDNQDLYREEMERIIVHNPLYLYMNIIDESGEPVSTIPNVHSSSASYKQIVERLEWSKTFYISNLIKLDDGRSTIALGYPILDETGAYKGAVIGYVNLHVLSEYLRQVKLGKKGVNALIDQNGTIIAHTNDYYLGKSLRSPTLKNYLYKSRFGIWRGELFGSEMLLAYRPIESGGFGLIVGESTDQALLPANNVQSVLLRGFIIALLVTVLFTFVGVSRVVKPITKLTNQAHQYKEGRRSSFDLIETGDEIENLSFTMNEMASDLRDKERRLFYILESVPYGVITTDQEGRVMTFNKGAEQLTLYKREEALGKYIIDLPLKATKHEFISWKTLKEGKQFHELESYIYDKEGKKHDVRMYSSLFTGDENQIIGAILVIRDVEEIKKLEEFLRQSERLASLGQLTAGIAHEIKNPISIIQAATEAIQFDLSEEEIDEDLINEMTDDILETSERLNDLLADFLKMSRGDMTENREKVNLVVLLNEILSLLRNQFEDRRIQLEKDYGVEEAYVLGDSSHLSQVFLNMILNGIQAIESQGTFKVKISDQETEWNIELEDNGGGIPESHLNWIFTPFYTTKNEGTGLGLSIAHEIVTQHGGKVEASSEGDHTTMKIQLPKIKHQSEGEDE